MNVLITGGASGLGNSITKRMAQQSLAKVWFTYNNSIEKAREIEREYSNATAIRCDFTNTKEVEKLVRQMKQININALVNNAFSTKISEKHFHKTEIEAFINSFNWNILPLIRITQQAISQFRKNKFGKIVTILSSSLINKPPLGYSEYTACKAYVASLTKSWANENISFNITSNCISPSFMLTNLTGSVDERVLENLISIHPLKRLLTMDEVADSVSFLINGSQQINGINLIMNSGIDVI